MTAETSPGPKDRQDLQSSITRSLPEEDAAHQPASVLPGTRGEPGCCLPEFARV